MQKLTILVCGAAAAALFSVAVLAAPNTGGSGGLNYTCGAWGPSTSKPGFQCRRCERCATKDGKIDCTTVEVKNQCTDGPTNGIDPPAPLTGGARPPYSRAPAVGVNRPLNASPR